jgi:hypothetical protein
MFPARFGRLRSYQLLETQQNKALRELVHMTCTMIFSSWHPSPPPRLSSNAESASSGPNFHHRRISARQGGSSIHEQIRDLVGQAVSLHDPVGKTDRVRCG